MHAASPHAGATALAFSDISHRYEKRGQASLLALNDIKLELKAGEFVAIVGPSGCGKTTLLRLAAGLIQPSEGTVAIHGQRVQAPREDVSMIFQDAVISENFQF